LTAQVLTTVGYGDVSWDHTTFSMVFFIFYVMASTLVVSTVVSNTVDKMMAQRMDNISSALFLQAEQTRKAQKEEREGRGDEPTEKDKQADVAGMQVTTAQGTLRKAFLVFAGFMVSGAAFFALHPEEKKTWLEAWYAAAITLSTIGFGDHAAISPLGRVFSSFWMIFGVISTGNLVAAFANVVSGTKSRRRMAKLSPHLLEQMDANRDGHVSRHEFLIYVLQTEGLVNDVVLKEIDDNFNALDEDGTGDLSVEDLELFMQRRRQ